MPSEDGLSSDRLPPLLLRALVLSAPARAPVLSAPASPRRVSSSIISASCM